MCRKRAFEQGIKEIKFYNKNTILNLSNTDWLVWVDWEKDGNYYDDENDNQLDESKVDNKVVEYDDVKNNDQGE